MQAMRIDRGKMRMTNTDSLIALLPCPFCGNAAELCCADEGKPTEFYWIGCTNDNCLTLGGYSAYSAVKAVKDWNTRTTQTNVGCESHIKHIEKSDGIYQCESLVETMENRKFASASIYWNSAIDACIKDVQQHFTESSIQKPVTGDAVQGNLSCGTGETAPASPTKPGTRTTGDLKAELIMVAGTGLQAALKGTCAGQGFNSPAPSTTENKDECRIAFNEWLARIATPIKGYVRPQIGDKELKLLGWEAAWKAKPSGYLPIDDPLRKKCRFPKAQQRGYSVSQGAGLESVTDIINGLHADIDEIVRVAKTNPKDIRGFLKANYAKHWNSCKRTELACSEISVNAGELLGSDTEVQQHGRHDGGSIPPAVSHLSSSPAPATESSDTYELTQHIEESLSYFCDEFPKIEGGVKIWESPISYHCGGITPNDLQTLLSILYARKPVSLKECIHAAYTEWLKDPGSLGDAVKSAFDTAGVAYVE